MRPTRAGRLVRSPCALRISFNFLTENIAATIFHFGAFLGMCFWSILLVIWSCWQGGHLLRILWQCNDLPTWWTQLCSYHAQVNTIEPTYNPKYNDVSVIMTIIRCSCDFSMLLFETKSTYGKYFLKPSTFKTNTFHAVAIKMWHKQSKQSV